MSKANAISKTSKEAAEIIGAQDTIGQISPGFKASLVVCNADPFTLSSHPVLVIAEGGTIYDER
jgi:imidazolonepropionase-like amidohydrolase